MSNKISSLIKTCKECKWGQPDRYFSFWFSKKRWEFARCTREQKKIIDLTTGHFKYKTLFCSLERDDAFLSIGVCGKDGRYWEKKDGT